ncbi:MAG: CHAT domain-containing protein [Nannocystaceae bacterium]|nr:CHAT domain-containing protein [Nannocystaceae bacterium]
MSIRASVVRSRWGIGMLVVMGSCRSETADPPAPAATPHIEAAVIGCVDLRTDRTCVFEPGRPLTVWAALDHDAMPRLFANGKRLPFEGTAVADGVRWTLDPQASWHTLNVEGLSGQTQLALRRRGPSVPQLEQIRAFQDAGQTAEAQSELTKTLPTLPRTARAQGHELGGDLAFLRGDIKAAIESYEFSARLYAEQSRYRKASTVAHRIAYACTALEPDEACARAWLDRDADWIQGDPEQLVLHDYYRALFNARLGDRRAAQRGFASSIERSRAFGLQSVQFGAQVEAMLLVASVGNCEAAKAHQAGAQALGTTLPSAMQAQLHNAIGWMLLLARARGQAHLSRPTPAFERALQLTQGDDAISRRLRATLQLNLAYDALLDDDLESVQRWLATVDRDALLHEDERMWAALLLARVDVRLGNLDAARDAFATLATKATKARESELAWHAHIGTAEVLGRQGRAAEALISHEKAATILTRQLPRIALGAGRSHYLAERARGTQQHIELLLESGRIEDALCVTRRARTRNLRVLAQNINAGDDASRALRSYREGRTRLDRDLETAWMLPADQAEARFTQLHADRVELDRTLDRDVFAGSVQAARSCDGFPTTKHNEVSLYYVELEHGWVGFSADTTGTSMHHLGPRPESQAPRAMSRWLLEPFARTLSEAHELRVVASGTLHAIAFSRLPDPSLPTQAIGQRLGVAYGLDVPRPPSSRVPQHQRRILVLAPPSNLPAAQTERDAVLAASHDDAEIQILSGDEATGEAVRRVLPNVEQVHFVGHAAYDDDGWTGGLQLARNDTLEVEDVLALQSVPKLLVLAGCETGRVDAVALAGGMSLAHAFLLAGADTVVAAGHQISDQATAALARPFYAELGRKNSVPRALALAQDAVVAQGFTPPALRVWVR